MITVTLAGGNTKQYNTGITAYAAARDISEGLARAACAAEVDGKLCDLRAALTADCSLRILTFEDEGGRWAFRHTASHCLAQAVKRLWPEAKLAIGPAIDNGFYYDIDYPLTMSELPQIEAEMKKIIKEGLEPERFELSRADALKWTAEQDESYKTELIEALPEGEAISFYKQGEFTDLCAGPHLMNVKAIKAFRLTSVAGAYWRGDEKNKMLTRIYGTAFTKAADLEAYLIAVEEAKKRDHNKLGRELRLFTTSEVVGQGLPLLMPKGARIVQLLQRFVEDEEERRGYVLTKTPFMAKSDLYKISGHWDHYKEGMFILGDEEKDDEVFALRPMTCPFQYTVYNAEQHSYRDLPIRYGETSTLFRNEASGEMHGLIRVRQFTLAEGHLVCTREQLEEEFRGAVELIDYIMNTLGIQDDVSYQLSLGDRSDKKKFIGDDETWNEAEAIMRRMLKELNLTFKEEIGDAAFYGPKLDIQFKNVHGKEDTIITVQVDPFLADRFDMTYTDRDGVKKRPFIIHRSSIGCYERTLAMLIEKYAGAFPTWLSPMQAIVLPISDRYNDYAAGVLSALKNAGIRAEADYRSEKIGYKIREARSERIPYLLVVGEKEAENGQVAVRSRQGDEGAADTQAIIDRIRRETAEHTLNVEL